MPDRVYPMRKPAGHKPAIQRYSARFGSGPVPLGIQFLGMQAHEPDALTRVRLWERVSEGFAGEYAPARYDFARYVDTSGCENLVAAAYWTEPGALQAWRSRPDVASWWSNSAHVDAAYGLWREAFEVPVDRAETNLFRDCLGGLGACPAARIEPMEESGYFGAARDRMPASAYDLLEPTAAAIRRSTTAGDTRGRRLIVKPLANTAVIRSGVSWARCGEEQLRDYQQNLKVKLDAGMEYLRSNGEEVGCYSLRQVECLSPDAATMKEAYSLGYFLSFGHLEHWAHHHPSHLAIYTRALADRKRYQERLELKTYQEIYVLPDAEQRFEYVNCHAETGLLPYLPHHAE